MDYKYAVRDVCVLPTGQPLNTQETQFEAFQSILAYLLNAEEGSPYSVLLARHGIPFRQLQRGERYSTDGIYCKPPVQGSTHYFAVVNRTVYDPYKFYQPPGTQGFCQLFAYLLYLIYAKGRTFPLTVVTPTDSLVAKFDTYVENTYQVLQLFLMWTQTEREMAVAVRAAFQALNPSSRRYYGIRCTSPAVFLADLATLNRYDTALYIYDNPLPAKSARDNPMLWQHINDTYAIALSPNDVARYVNGI